MRPIRLATALGLGMLATPAPTFAQMGSMGGNGPRSLGGYGSATISSYYVSRTPGYAPYAASGSGYAPRVIPMPAPVGRPASTPIGGASQSDMAARAAMADAFRTPRRPLPMAGGMGLGGSGMTGGMTRSAATPAARPGPGLGWPFRMPPALPGRASMGMGGP